MLITSSKQSSRGEVWHQNLLCADLIFEPSELMWFPPKFIIKWCHPCGLYKLVVCTASNAYTNQATIQLWIFFFFFFTENLFLAPENTFHVSLAFLELQRKENVEEREYKSLKRRDINIICIFRKFVSMMVCWKNQMQLVQGVSVPVDLSVLYQALTF